MNKNHDTEAQRIRRILDGRSDEYGYFVRTYSAQVLDFVSRMVSDAGDMNGGRFCDHFFE